MDPERSTPEYPEFNTLETSEYVPPPQWREQEQEEEQWTLQVLFACYND